MTVKLGGTFERFNDPSGNPLFAVNRDGSVQTTEVIFPDGTIQNTAGKGPYSINGATDTTINGLAAGQLLSYNNILHKWVNQNKTWIDVRDYGVTCDGVTDDTAALQAIFTGGVNGKFVVFPQGAVVKITSTILIKNQSSFRIGAIGTAPTPNGFLSAPTVRWFGTAGGIMFDLEYCDGFEVDGIVFDGHALAGVNLNIDATGGGGTVITTAGAITRCCFSNGSQGGGQTNWVGLQFSNVSQSNVEDMRVWFCYFYGGNTSNAVGLRVGSSPNAKNYSIRHNNIHFCSVGLVCVYGFSGDVSWNEFGDNINTDISIGLVSDQTRVSYNLSESANSGCNFLTISAQTNDNLEISGNHFPLNDVDAIQIDGAIYIIAAANRSYPGFSSTGRVWSNIGTHGPSIVIGPHYLTPQQLGRVVTQNQIRNSFSGLGSSGEISSNTVNALILSTGSRFLSRWSSYNSQDDTGIGLSTNGLQNTIPSMNINSVLEWEGGREVAGCVSPDGLSVTVTGADVSVPHLYLISAIDSLGHETLLRGGYTNNGPATYDGTHFETLNWLGSQGAVSYNLYAANVSDALKVNQIATGVSGTTYQFNGPYPVTFPITSIRQPYNGTLRHIFRGRSVELQYGTTLTGYSDKGATSTWGISSVGTATFPHVNITSLQTFANNAAAITGGLAAGNLYRTSGDPAQVCVVF